MTASSRRGLISKSKSAATGRPRHRRELGIDHFNLDLRRLEPLPSPTRLRRPHQPPGIKPACRGGSSKAIVVVEGQPLCSSWPRRAEACRARKAVNWPWFSGKTEQVAYSSSPGFKSRHRGFECVPGPRRIPPRRHRAATIWRRGGAGRRRWRNRHVGEDGVERIPDPTRRPAERNRQPDLGSRPRRSRVASMPAARGLQVQRQQIEVGPLEQMGCLASRERHRHRDAAPGTGSRQADGRPLGSGVLDRDPAFGKSGQTVPRHRPLDQERVVAARAAADSFLCEQHT